MKNYLKCSCEREDYKESCSDEHRNAKFRYCPEDGRNCSCQVQGWTSQDLENHETEFLGFENLEKYGFNITQVLQSTYDHYWQYGNSPPAPKIGTDIAFTSDMSGLFLPTCVSKRVNLTDFDGKMEGYLDRKRQQQFPCTCGDWRSNETTAFMRKIYMGYDQSDMITGKARETFATICPQVRYHPKYHFTAKFFLSSFPSIKGVDHADMTAQED
jgi:hypothetical protein